MSEVDRVNEAADEKVGRTNGSGEAGPDQGDGLPRLNVQGDVFQGRTVAAGVGDGYIVEVNRGKGARWQSGKVARLQSCKVARLQSCKVAKSQGCKVAKL